MHRHVWKIESRVTHQSAWEQMNAGGRVEKLNSGRNAQLLFVQPVIVTYVCECGAQKVERV